MCQKIWAGVSPSLPIPKLTQYIQFVKSGQKIWAGPSPPSFGQNPKEQLFFFGRPSLTWYMGPAMEAGALTEGRETTHSEKQS